MAGLVGTVDVPTSGFLGYRTVMQCTSVGLAVSLGSLVQQTVPGQMVEVSFEEMDVHRRLLATCPGQPRPPTSLYKACPGLTEVPSEATWGHRGLLVDTPCMYSPCLQSSEKVPRILARPQGGGGAAAPLAECLPIIQRPGFNPQPYIKPGQSRINLK